MSIRHNHQASIPMLNWSILLNKQQLWAAKSGNLLYIYYVFNKFIFFTICIYICSQSKFLETYFMHFSFWYYIFDESTLESSLKLKMIRDKDEKLLLGISESNTTFWKKSTSFLGNQPGGYKVSL